MFHCILYPVSYCPFACAPEPYTNCFILVYCTVPTRIKSIFLRQSHLYNEFNILLFSRRELLIFLVEGFCASIFEWAFYHCSTIKRALLLFRISTCKVILEFDGYNIGSPNSILIGYINTSPSPTLPPYHIFLQNIPKVHVLLVCQIPKCKSISLIFIPHQRVPPFVLPFQHNVQSPRCHNGDTVTSPTLVLWTLRRRKRTRLTI